MGAFGQEPPDLRVPGATLALAVQKKLVDPLAETEVWHRTLWIVREMSPEDSGSGDS